MSSVDELRDWFEKQVVENYRLFYHIANQILRDSHLAEEAVQESALKGWRDLGDLQNPATIVGWLARITRNFALDLKKKHTPDAMDAEALDSRPGADAPVESGEERQMLLEAIAQLPEGQAVVITLRFFEEMDVEQISRTLSLAPNAVRVRLHRALEGLRRRPRLRQFAQEST